MIPRVHLRHAPVLIAGALGLAALTTLAWPISEAPKAPTSRDMVYGGAEHALRFTDPSTGVTPVRLTSAQTLEIAATAPATPAPVLVGLIGDREAYLRSAVSGEVSRIRLGSELDGWRLIAIRGRAVTLRRGETDHTAALFERRGSDPTVLAQTPAAIANSAATAAAAAQVASEVMPGVQ